MSSTESTNTSSSSGVTSTGSDGDNAVAAAPAKFQNTCEVCQKPAKKTCSRCKKVGVRGCVVYYCSSECQKKHWKVHKLICNETYQFGQWEMHKKSFERIVEKYGLKTEKKSEEISELLSGGAEGVSSAEFAAKFDMDINEAVIFLEWIKIGVNFKMSTAKNADAFTGAVGAAKDAGALSEAVNSAANPDALN